ncbi:MAG: hypothetical protein IKS43_00955 [Clostridia bacterium]|nr:hypothetical protein [Clostridia bacterium]
MKGTEMFDAIAHIDEDLIDRCLEGGNNTDKRADAAASSDQDTVQRIDPKTSRRRSLAAFAAAAAALVLTLGVISLLHIGRESPWRPGTESSESPEITEAILTEAPTQDPAAALSEDAQALRRYFELTDENGVKNGEKLFPNYNPDDPASWKDDGAKVIVFDDEGQLTFINLTCAESESVTLTGDLDLTGFKKLNTFWTVFLDIDGSLVYDNIDANKLCDLTCRRVTGEAIYRGNYLERVRLLSAKRTLVETTAANSGIDWLTFDFRVEVNVEGAGYAGVNAWTDENYYELHLVAEPMEGANFIGWYYADGTLASTEYDYELYGEESGKDISGVHHELEITAVFDSAQVPEGYDPHEYAVLAEFFSTPVSSLSGETIGEDCYGDSDSSYSIDDPSSWHTDYFGVKWDSTGHVTEITFYPSYDNLHAELDLTGFEKLEKVAIWYTTLDKLTIADCPKLTDGCMVYTGSAKDAAYVEAGYVNQLHVTSRTKVYCSLISDKGTPFTLDLTADGMGSVTASAASTEEDGSGYRVAATANADNYVNFLGWYDEDGTLITNEITILMTDDGSAVPIGGDHKYVARFSQPPAPTPIPEGDFFCEIVPNVPSAVDIDGDGAEDTVLVSITESDSGIDYDLEMTVNITLARDPENTYTFETDGYPGDVCAAAVDFDPTDGHTEVLVSYDCEDGDPLTYVYRLKDDGTGFDEFLEPIEVTLDETRIESWYYNGIPEGFAFDSKKGLGFSRRTEILGTTFVFNSFTVDKTGIRYADDEFMYIVPEGQKFELKRDLTVTLESGKTITLKKGDKFEAYSTDRQTYLKIKLEDGRIGKVDVRFGDGTSWPVYLNGINQGKYIEPTYAD